MFAYFNKLAADKINETVEQLFRVGRKNGYSKGNHHKPIVLNVKSSVDANAPYELSLQLLGNNNPIYLSC